MRIFIMILIAVALFLITGCGVSNVPPEPGPVTDAADIVGTWEHLGTYTQFNADGTCRTASSIEGLAERSWAMGEYWFEEGQYHEKEIEVHNVPSCGSVIGTYEIQMLENGNLVFTRVEDECEDRGASIVGGEYKRVG